MDFTLSLVPVICDDKNIRKKSLRGGLELI